MKVWINCDSVGEDCSLNNSELQRLWLTMIFKRLTVHAEQTSRFIICSHETQQQNVHELNKTQSGHHSVPGWSQMSFKITLRKLWNKTEPNHRTELDLCSVRNTTGILNIWPYGEWLLTCRRKYPSMEQFKSLNRMCLMPQTVNVCWCYYFTRILYLNPVWIQVNVF